MNEIPQRVMMTSNNPCAFGEQMIIDPTLEGGHTSATYADTGP